MNEYRVYYTTNEDDHCKVRVNASSISEAEQVFKRQYWDCKEISSIQEV